jgi:hypothetical protein
MTKREVLEILDKWEAHIRASRHPQDSTKYWTGALVALKLVRDDVEVYISEFDLLVQEAGGQ